MNETIKRLYHTAGKDSRIILGLMSGTSMDGLDLALCRFEGHGRETRVQVLAFDCMPYEDDFLEALRRVAFRENAPLSEVCRLNKLIAQVHAKMVNACLQSWKVDPEDIDLMASHGQTVMHIPSIDSRADHIGHSTLQLGDGDWLSVHTGIICLSDFRQKHIAAGGQGAPLVSYGDYLLFAENDKPVILLNIGGIANLSYIPAGATFGDVMATDTGPGNRMMDAFIRNRMEDVYFDEAGNMAASGDMHQGLLDALSDHPFFAAPYPKTTGPELFNLDYLSGAMHRSNTRYLSTEDVLATLSALTANSISHAIKSLPSNENPLLYVSGGGAKNKFLLSKIEKITGLKSVSTEEKNIPPDAKEAVLFALLANETIAGDMGSLGPGSENMPAISMGKISFPY